MIYKIDMNNPIELIDIIQLQKASYLIEAELINFYQIPGLLDNERTLLESEETFYGYRREGILVGIISYKIHEKTLDIHRVAVHPNYFNQGIATVMLEEIENIVEAIDRIIVSTGKENYPACKLYEKSGYKLIGEMEVVDGLKMVVFEKKIG